MKAFYKIFFLFFLVNLTSCLNKQKDCGCEILPKPKIIGGKKANPLAYPWMVSISRFSDNTTSYEKKLINEIYKIKYHSCGGAIINEYWILTAAHCLPEDKTKSLYVGYGNGHDLTKIFDFGRIKSSRTIRNSGYNEDSENDIGLIELEEPIKFTESVKPACFSKEKIRLYSGLLQNVGWGSTQTIKEDPFSGSLSKSKTSKYLKEMLSVDKSNTYKDCTFDKNIICAKGNKENESSCKGDSGGPIHHFKNGKSFVVGLSSYLREKILKYGYFHYCIGTTVYTRVSSYIDWIKYYVNDDICDF